MASSAMSAVQNAPRLSIPQDHPHAINGAPSATQPALASAATSHIATVYTTDVPTASPIDARSPSLPNSSSDSTLPSSSFPSLSATSTGIPGTPNSADDLEVPEAILEALRSPKERLYMLKLGETMETLIRERSPTDPYPRRTLQPTTSYHRLLIHKSSAYHRITPDVDQANKTISIIVNLESRIPARRISELVPLDVASSGPTFKIMRRNTPEQRSKSRNMVAPTSSSSSVADVSPSLGTATSTESSSPPSANGTYSTEPTDEDDGSDPILRSLGLPTNKSGRSNGTSTPRKTIEERAAAYNEARSRIFMDFEEKEKVAAKTREDREREREVTEMHRKLAEEEDMANIVVHELPRTDDSAVNGAADVRQQFLAANGHLHIRPATAGPMEHDGPLRGARGVPSPSPIANRDKPLAMMPTIGGFGGELDPHLMSDPSAPPVTYPTLYDPDSNHDPALSHQPPSSRMYDIPSNSYEPGALQSYEPPHQYAPSPHGGHPPYPGNPYPSYPMGNMGPMPPMNGGGPPMMMGGYPYPGMPNQQQPNQPMASGSNMMASISYPYYPPMGHGTQSWGESHGAFGPGPRMDGQPGENGYGPYGSHLPHPQQQAYWPQQSQQPQQSGQPNDMSGPNQPYSINGQPLNYAPPPMPYYGPTMQQQPYAPQQQPNPYALQPPHQQYPPHFSGPTNQRGSIQPGQNQQQRQLWTPGAGGTGGGKRDPHPRASFSAPQRTGQGRAGPSNSQIQPGGMGPPLMMPNGNQRMGGGPGPSRGLPPPRDSSRDLATLMATPMNPSSRSRNSSISTGSSPNVHLGMGFGRGVWTPPEQPLRFVGNGAVSPSGSTQGMSLAGSMRSSFSDRRRSGSLSGSVSENISVAGDESGTRTPLDETASMASSSISSASSSRTYTSTSSKHPSLPPRPDWVLGLTAGSHGFPSVSPSISSHSSHRGKSGSSSSSSNPAHSRTHSFQSNGRSPYIPQPNDFPPLPGVAAGAPPLSPQRAVTNPPTKNTVWSNPRPALVLSQSANATASLNPQPVFPNRFEEHDGKFTRPAPKGATQLFDPRAAGKARASTPTEDQFGGGPMPVGPSSEEQGLAENMAGLEVNDAQTAQPLGLSA